MKKPKDSAIKYVLTALISILLTAILCFALVWGFLFDDIFLSLKYKEIKNIIDNNYIGEYDEDAAKDAMFDGFVDSIGDRYSEYYNVEESNEKENATEGRFYGFGAIVTKHPDNGTIYVKHVYNDGSAAKAGIKDGDEIISVGEADVKESYSKALQLLQGLQNETVLIKYLHNGETKSAEIAYSDCTAQSVYYEKISDYGYIEIISFNGATVNQFKDAVDNLVSDSVKGLIFDLRDNGGGTVDSVCEMLDYICPQGDLMYAKYGSEGEKKVLKKSDAEHNIELNMAVIVNGSTASASEIFAANIRDFSKGVLIGETTFGKGVMQLSFKLTDGSTVKTTVAEVFPHSGNSYNGKGLKPDIEVNLTEEQENRIVLLKGDNNPYISAALEYLKNEK